MVIIAGQDLNELLGLGAIQEMIDPVVQVQMCGVDMTLMKAERFLSSGAVDYNNKERNLPETEEIPFDKEGWIDLEAGAYRVTFNETVDIPEDMTALAKPRSTLLRCGATMETALWDPGYRGKSQSLLVIHNPSGLRLKKNGRLMQLVFYRLSSAAEKLYEGAYQGENL